MDRSATQKGERRPLAIDQSSFGLTGGETEEPNEKGKRQAAMTATCNDCIFNRLVAKKRGSQIFFTKDDVASALVPYSCRNSRVPASSAPIPVILLAKGRIPESCGSGICL